MRGDRTLTVVRAVTFGLAGGLGLGLTSTLFLGLADWLVDGLVVGRWFGPMFGLVVGLPFGLPFGLAFGAWPAFLITSLWLAGRRRLPLRLMGFLQDAYRLGLLRIVGSSCQFRHAELQDHLARDSRTSD